jgi:hypothetical protein
MVKDMTKRGYFIAWVIGMNKTKKCTKCEVHKPFKDFYLCKGNPRGECKACTIRRNVSYQRRVEAWKFRYVDHDVNRKYMTEYYRSHKEKYKEYRKKFKERYPHYHRDYARRRKGEKVICSLKAKTLDD